LNTAALTFSARVASRNFDLEFTVMPGETVAILGPNGAGKSTLLGLIAGTIRADAGSATLGKDTLFHHASNHATNHATFVPPHSRGVSLLSQDALLFPHLTVLENVAFGPRSSGMKARPARDIAREWLAVVNALDLQNRSSRHLSGGQAQRVAVARALASEPRLLLLDEPLAALDVAVAPALRRLLKGVLADRTALIVTHDVLDALTLADRVIVVEGGRIVEQGLTREVLSRPRSVFSARLAALNLLTGVRTATGLRTGRGAEVIGTERTGAEVTGAEGRGHAAITHGTRVAAAIRPADISISPAPPSARANVARATLDYLEPRGDIVRAHCTLAEFGAGTGTSTGTGTSIGTETLMVDMPPLVAAELNPESPVWLSWDASATTLYAL
jgi:molybdate transport system ATP-binding protein